LDGLSSIAHERCFKGPDYVAIAAGEAEDPRKTMPRAFSTTVHRLAIFFILGAICVGTLIPYNDPDLVESVINPKPGVGASPFVMSMGRLKIKVLPHIVNALVLSSVFSAGNTYFYIGSRILFGLALEGKAPKILAKCTKRGVPIYSVIIMVLFSFLGEACLVPLYPLISQKPKPSCRYQKGEL
jgi:amino acid transporter